LGKLFDEWIEMTQQDVDEVCGGELYGLEPLTIAS
jgi:hypothetical protein